jgi:hypothetical protein
MSPAWWTIALPTLTAVLILIAGLYANVKVLLEIKKLQIEQQKIQLETQRLRRELEERNSRIHTPTDEELSKILDLYNINARESGRSAFMLVDSKGYRVRVDDQLSELVRSVRELNSIADRNLPFAMDALRHILDRLDFLARCIQGREDRGGRDGAQGRN